MLHVLKNPLRQLQSTHNPFQSVYEPIHIFRLCNTVWRSIITDIATYKNNVMEYLNQLEKMLESGHRIITMESYEVDRLCDLFLEMSRFSPKPYYLAQPEQAMHRLGASHIGIPKTNKPEDLMEHI